MLVSIGNTVVDLYIRNIWQLPSVGKDEFSSTNHILCPSPIHPSLGGNGAISAFVFASLGSAASLVSALGCDEFGEIVYGWLEDRGVELSGLWKSQTNGTSISVIATDSRLNRLAFHYPGASANFTLREVDFSVIRSGKLLLLCGYSLMPGLRGKPSVEILHLAKSHGLVTAIDIGPGVDDSVTLDELAAGLQYVDYFLANSWELQIFTRTNDLRKGMQQIAEAGASWIVIKRGPDGVVLKQRGRAEILSVPAFQVQVTGTVGAGDTFNAAFLHAVGRKQPELVSARYANATAALVISRNRGVLACPNHQEVLHFLGEGNEQT